MGRFLLRLRRRSVRKLGEAWQRRLGARSRIVPLAMLIGVAAAVAAAVCRENVVIPGAECAAKSYPRFWEDLDTLKGEKP